MIWHMLAIWSLVPLPFLNLTCTSGSSRFTCCWSLAWRILSVILLACEKNAIIHNLIILWHCPSLELEWKRTFPVLWPLLSFPILLAYWAQCFHSIISLFSSVSLLWSLRKAFLSLRAILWNSAFKWVYQSFSPLFFTSLLFTAICKVSSDILPFCIAFSWG